MSTETAAYAQLKAMGERFVNTQSTVVCDIQKSDREIVTEVLAEFFDFVEESELERVKKELDAANKAIGDLGDEVSRLTVDLKNTESQRDEFKRQLDKFNQL
jgi:predicted  nucleic acid-binding Zn-ribbon protein